MIFTADVKVLIADRFELGLGLPLKS